MASESRDGGTFILEQLCKEQFYANTHKLLLGGEPNQSNTDIFKELIFTKFLMNTFYQSQVKREGGDATSKYGNMFNLIQNLLSIRCLRRPLQNMVLINAINEIQKQENIFGII